MIFILSVPKPRLLSSAEPPHIHFAPYTKEESIKILSKYVRRIPFQDIEEYTEEDAKEELYVWQKFCGTVWDSLAKGTARGIVQFRAIVDEMWEPFVKPIAEGKYGTRNYSSLYLLHKEMFRQETNVIDVVVPVGTGEKAVTKSESARDPPCGVGDYGQLMKASARPSILLQISPLRGIPSIIQPRPPRRSILYEEQRLWKKKTARRCHRPHQTYCEKPKSIPSLPSSLLCLKD